MQNNHCYKCEALLRDIIITHLCNLTIIPPKFIYLLIKFITVASVSNTFLKNLQVCSAMTRVSDIGTIFVIGESQAFICLHFVFCIIIHAKTTLLPMRNRYLHFYCMLSIQSVMVRLTLKDKIIPFLIRM